MTDKVEIFTDAAGNKQSVMMPFHLYERLLSALTAHETSMNVLMGIATQMVELQEIHTASPTVAAAAALPESQVLADTVPLSPASKDPKQDIRSYQRARGYFTETGGFWVLEGSVARFIVSNAFEAIESLVTLRRKLVDEGVLVNPDDFPDYVFTRDCYFPSASMAACIVDGNARNSPSVWRKK